MFEERSRNDEENLKVSRVEITDKDFLVKDYYCLEIEDINTGESILLAPSPYSTNEKISSVGTGSFENPYYVVNLGWQELIKAGKILSRFAYEKKTNIFVSFGENMIIQFSPDFQLSSVGQKTYPQILECLQEGLAQNPLS